MNLAEQMLARTKIVQNREKLDIIFEKYVLPRIEKAANAKRKEVEFTSSSVNEEDMEVQKQFPHIHYLQTLIETDMKPYLEEKGFSIITSSPSYYVKITWYNPKK